MPKRLSGMQFGELGEVKDAKVHEAKILGNKNPKAPKSRCLESTHSK